MATAAVPLETAAEDDRKPSEWIYVGVTCACGWSGKRRSRRGLFFTCPKCGRTNDGPARIAEREARDLARAARAAAKAPRRPSVTTTQGSGQKGAAAPSSAPPPPAAPKRPLTLRGILNGEWEGRS